MKKWYIKVVQQRLARHFTRNFSRIPSELFVVGDMRYNYQCHRNAAHECYLDATKKSVLVYAVDRRDESFCLHVINKLSDGTYQDNTWGSEFEFHHYYFIKDILPDQHARTIEFFDDHRKDYIRLYAKHWLIRFLQIQPTDIF